MSAIRVVNVIDSAKVSTGAEQLIPPRINIILDVRPYHILGGRLVSSPHPSPLMQETPLRLAVREQCHAALDGLHWERVHGALSRPRQEECGLAGVELVIEVDQEGEEGGLFCAWKTGVVLVGIVWQNARGRPCAVCEGNRLVRCNDGSGTQYIPIWARYSAPGT